MTCVDLALPRVKAAEGFRSSKYLDTVGKITIGYGFNVDAGITEPAAAALLTAQLYEIENELSKFWWAFGLDDVRMSVVLEVAFNVGSSGLLHFVNMLAAIGKKDWHTARDELLDSAAAKMLPARYGKLADILESGNP